MGAPQTPTVFAPPAERWLRLSPKLVWVRRLTLSVTMLLLIVGVATSLWFILSQTWPALSAAAVGVLLWVWLWFRTRREVASWGYAERDADLCVTHGLWFRELIVVPFGRMQVVKVTSGPLTRAFGLATVELVTASPATGASIPGLPLEEARALRDRLIELSDAKGSGL
ncbi:MAG: PH domain-containing protein [Propioniciclava sp.]